jgi:hypothetical protein
MSRLTDETTETSFTRRTTVESRQSDVTIDAKTMLEEVKVQLRTGKNLEDFLTNYLSATSASECCKITQSVQLIKDKKKKERQSKQQIQYDNAKGELKEYIRDIETEIIRDDQFAEKSVIELNRMIEEMKLGLRNAEAKREVAKYIRDRTDDLPMYEETLKTLLKVVWKKNGWAF